MAQDRRRQGQNRKGVELPSPHDLDTIIRGDDVESAKCTDKWGKKIGTALQRDLKTAQIRNIFGKVRLIEADWASNESRSLRQLILLKAKLRYQAERKREVKELADLLSKAIDLVAEPESGDRMSAGDKFQRFVDFFEAILAYHKVAGGK